jgi:hypothetical protein
MKGISVRATNSQREQLGIGVKTTSHLKNLFFIIIYNRVTLDSLGAWAIAHASSLTFPMSLKTFSIKSFSFSLIFDKACLMRINHGRMNLATVGRRMLILE